RSLNLLATRRLHFLTARGLNFLTRTRQGPRCLDLLALHRHVLLSQHLLRLCHLGRARGLRVGHRHKGGEERYAHDRRHCHHSLHRVFLPRVSSCCTEIATFPVEIGRSHLPAVRRVVPFPRVHLGGQVEQGQCHTWEPDKA